MASAGGAVSLIVSGVSLTVIPGEIPGDLAAAIASAIKRPLLGGRPASGEVSFYTNGVVTAVSSQDTGILVGPPARLPRRGSRHRRGRYRRRQRGRRRGVAT